MTRGFEAEVFTGWLRYLSPKQQCRSTEGIHHSNIKVSHFEETTKHKNKPRNILQVFLTSRYRSRVCKASAQLPGEPLDQYLHRARALSEWVSSFTSRSTHNRSFQRYESFQAITCTGKWQLETNKRKYTKNTKQQKTNKLAPDKKTHETLKKP